MFGLPLAERQPILNRLACRLLLRVEYCGPFDHGGVDKVANVVVTYRQDLSTLRTLSTLETDTGKPV